MKLIIDNNVLFSLMKPDSVASRIFSFLSCEFIAPSFILHEFEKYKEECLKKSRLSKKDFEDRKSEILSHINFIEFSEYKEFIKEALKGLIDEDDSCYIALGLKIQAPIWSNDKDMKKQEKVTILSTEDLIQIIF
jgi:predicted nucleic acid-binding protein